jgi:hypothetical protein
VLKFFINSEEILPREHGNFEEQNKVLDFFFIINPTCFGHFLCPSSGVYSLYNQQWYMSYRFEDSFRAGGPSCSCSKALFKTV